MATTDYNVNFDVIYIREFSKYLSKDYAFPNNNAKLMNSGMIQRDRLMEIVCADLSGGKYEMISEDKRDFSDNTDMKTVTFNYRPAAAGRPQVIITNINNKIGPLRVVALDPKTKKFYYFVIFDYESCRNYDRIEFSPFANSKYVNGECGVQFDTIQEMANWDKF